MPDQTMTAAAAVALGRSTFAATPWIAFVDVVRLVAICAWAYVAGSFAVTAPGMWRRRRHARAVLWAGQTLVAVAVIEAEVRKMGDGSGPGGYLWLLTAAGLLIAATVHKVIGDALGGGRE